MVVLEPWILGWIISPPQVSVLHTALREDKCSLRSSVLLASRKIPQKCVLCTGCLSSVFWLKWWLISMLDVKSPLLKCQGFCAPFLVFVLSTVRGFFFFFFLSEGFHSVLIWVWIFQGTYIQRTPLWIGCCPRCELDTPEPPTGSC